MYSWRLVLGSPRTRYWQVQCLVRVHFLVHRELSFAVNSHGRRDKVLAKASFVRTVIMFWSPKSYSLLHDRAIIERQVVGTRNSDLIHKTNRHIANMTKNRCVCMLSHFICVQLFATLWTVARQAPLSMGFSRQEYCSGLPWPPSGDLPNPGIEPASLISLHWQACSLQLAPLGKP